VGFQISFATAELKSRNAKPDHVLMYMPSFVVELLDTFFPTGFLRVSHYILLLSFQLSV
jgi:hypothetical protein